MAMPRAVSLQVRSTRSSLSNSPLRPWKCSSRPPSRSASEMEPASAREEMNSVRISMVASMAAVFPGTEKLPFTRGTPTSLSSPTAMPASCFEAASLACRFLMPREPSSCALNQSQTRASSNPDSAAASPSGPRDQMVVRCSDTTTIPASPRPPPAPATCAWSDQSVASRMASRSQVRSGSARIALSIRLALLVSSTGAPRNRRLLGVS